MTTGQISASVAQALHAGYAVDLALVCDYAIERQIGLPQREILNSEIAGEHAKLAEALGRLCGSRWRPIARWRIASGDCRW